MFFAYFVPLLNPLKVHKHEFLYKINEHANLVYFIFKGRVNMIIGINNVFNCKLILDSFLDICLRFLFWRN